jgi:hypothetical protein
MIGPSYLSSKAGKLREAAEVSRDDLGNETVGIPDLKSPVNS